MFRSLGKSKIAFVLAILFGISLFFFRGSNRYSNLFNSDNVVATVSGTPISTTKFLRLIQMNVNPSMALGILLNNAVFENEFDSKYFMVDETVVASETKKRFPNIYNENNKLDEIALNSFLSQQNLKIDDLVKSIDYEARNRVLNKLFFNVDYPKKMELILSKYNNHKRNVDLIKFNINDFKLNNFSNLDISINNNKIIDFFSENMDLYINPEKRNISYIIINKDDYTNQFIPSNSQIENYYKNNKNLFINPEKRDFIQFNFKNEEDADQFIKNINSYSNEDITKYAKENNILFNKFTNVSEDEVLEVLSKVIFRLQESEVSEIIETPLAKHVLIMNKIYPETTKNIDQSKEEISKTLLEVELDNYLLDLKNKINQQILDGFLLDEIAADNSLIMETLNNVERLDSEEQIDLIKSKVITKGFAINKDFVSDMINIDENRSIIINVDQIINEKPYELNEIFEIVSNDWIKSLKIKSIENFVDEINNNSKSLKDISMFVKTEITNNDIKIDHADYPSTFKNNVFTNEIDQIYLSVVNEDIYISKVNNISFPIEIENSQMISMLSELRGNFGAEIIKNKNISTNDNLIQALISQY